MLLSLTPFGAFTLFGETISVELGLWAAAILALGLVLSDWLRPESPVKMIDGGSALLFGGLALYTLFVAAPESVAIVRAIANGGLMSIALLSMAVGKPFSLQYARETAPQEAMTAPVFLKHNYIITAVWSGVFAILFGVSVAVLFALPPLWLARSIVYLVLIAGVGFTFWYLARLRREWPDEEAEA